MFFKNPRNNISPHNGGCSIYFQNFWILFLRKDYIESAFFLRILIMLGSLFTNTKGLVTK